MGHLGHGSLWVTHSLLWGSCCAPFRGGELGPHLTQWVEAYLRTKWHLDPSNLLAIIRQHYIQDRQDNGPVV